MIQTDKTQIDTKASIIKNKPIYQEPEIMQYFNMKGYYKSFGGFQQDCSGQGDGQKGCGWWPWCNKPPGSSNVHAT